MNIDFSDEQRNKNNQTIGIIQSNPIYLDRIIQTCHIVNSNANKQEMKRTAQPITARMHRT